MDSNIEDNILRFETTTFTSKCKDILGCELEAITEKLNNVKSQLQNSFESCAKSEMMKLIGTDNMYDYRPFYHNEPVEEIIKHIEIFYYRSYNSGIDKIKPNITKLIESEKYYIMHNISSWYDVRRNNTAFASFVFISVNGKVAVVDGKGDQNGNQGTFWRYSWNYEDLEFDIPAQYMHIIDMIKNQIKSSAFDVYVKMLKYIKDELYCTKYIPLYAKPVMTENARLRAKYDDYKIGMAKLAEDRRKLNEDQDMYNKYIKPYLCIKSEYDLINKEKDELNKTRAYLKDVKAKLIIEKKLLAEREKRLEDLDIGSLEL